MLTVAVGLAFASTSMGFAKNEQASYCEQRWLNSAAWIRQLPKQDQAIIIIKVKGEVNDQIRSMTEQTGGPNPLLIGYTQVYLNSMLSAASSKNDVLAELLSESSDNAHMVLGGEIDKSQFYDKTLSISSRMKKLIFGMDLNSAKAAIDKNQTNSLQASASVLCFSEELARSKALTERRRLGQ